jgi:hypothetical protein
MFSVINRFLQLYNRRDTHLHHYLPQSMIAWSDKHLAADSRTYRDLSEASTQQK